MEIAYKNLEVAKNSLRHNNYDGAISKAYYAMFCASKAREIASREARSKTEKSAISRLWERLVEDRMLDKKLNKTLTELTEFDDDMGDKEYGISRRESSLEKASRIIKKSESFLDKIKMQLEMI